MQAPVALNWLHSRDAVRVRGDALKEQYRYALGTYAPIGRLVPQAEALGAFAFFDPIDALRVMRNNALEGLDMTRECLIDIGSQGANKGDKGEMHFLRNGSRVLSVDGRFAKDADKKITSMAHNAGNKRVDVVRRMLNTSNVVSSLREFQMPTSCSTLKIDIDSIDCELLDTILTGGYMPDLIVIEANPTFPPPVLFSLRDGPHTRQWFHAGGPRTGLFGCSLSYATQVARTHGYELLQYVVEDAYFVPRSQRHKFGAALPRTPAECFAAGNPSGYYFDPDAAQQRLAKHPKVSSISRTLNARVHDDWAARGRAFAANHHSGRHAREELGSDVLSNVSLLCSHHPACKRHAMGEVLRVDVAGPGRHSVSRR